MEAFFSDPAVITLVLITFFAAIVNGALGYGFSSLTVPVALLFYTNRVLNPALVLLEVIINSYVLVMNRRSLPQVWRRVLPMLIGLVPGVIVGSYVLAAVHPGWIKFFTYIVILPFILIQAAGFRRFIKAERAVSVPFGTGVGILYSITTISGPPLALLFNNQGYVKEEFRAGLALVRITESLFTAVAYYFLGLYSATTPQLMLLIVPSIILGVPLGIALLQRVAAETFRRFCMSFDAWVVGFGLSRVLIELGVLASPQAYSILAATFVVDGWLLFRYFSKAGKQPAPVLAPSESFAD